jgi:hypothetical protein
MLRVVVGLLPADFVHQQGGWGRVLVSHSLIMAAELVIVSS